MDASLITHVESVVDNGMTPPTAKDDAHFYADEMITSHCVTRVAVVQIHLE